MEKILVIGAGGLGSEIADLIRAIGKYEVIGFLDDDPGKADKVINGLPVLGTIDSLEKYKKVKNIAIAIANPDQKKRIYIKAESEGFRFPNLIHPSVVLGSNVSFGRGIIICANTVISNRVTLHDFVTINPQCGIGHESALSGFSTLYWGVHVGGNVTIGEGCVFGTHSCVIQNIEITGNVLVGAGAVVVEDIHEKGTYVGVPARKLK